MRIMALKLNIDIRADSIIVQNPTHSRKLKKGRLFCLQNVYTMASNTSDAPDDPSSIWGWEANRQKMKFPNPTERMHSTGPYIGGREEGREGGREGDYALNICIHIINNYR